MGTPAHQRLKTLDGLRGIAVLWVVWFHLWQISWLENSFQVFGYRINFDFLATQGAFGVELFFFISGFCLYYSYAHLAAPAASSSTQGLGEFFFRRAIKILPSYWLCLAIVLIFFDRPFATSAEYFRHLISHLFFIHNWNYETSSSINGVLWSLGVEVQFYILFPLICFFFQRRPFISFLGFGLAAYLYRLAIGYYIPNNFDFCANQLPGFIDFFLSGMLAAWVANEIQQVGEAKLQNFRWDFTFAAGISLLILLLVVYAFHEIRYDPDKTWQWKIGFRSLFALLFFFLTVSSLFSSKYWKIIFENRLLIFFSTISYNLYIWHQYLGRKLIAWNWPTPGTPDPHDDFGWKLLYWAVAFPLSVGVAAFITYAFERPLLSWGSRFLKKAKVTRPKSIPIRSKAEKIPI